MRRLIQRYLVRVELQTLGESAEHGAANIDLLHEELDRGVSNERKRFLRDDAAGHVHTIDWETLSSMEHTSRFVSSSVKST